MPRDLTERYRLVVETLQVAFGERLKAVVLFGSQARGDARPESDHDLLLIIEDLPRDPLSRNRLTRSPLLPILAQLPGTISFVTRTPEEFQSSLTPLLLDICSDGVCLYGADYFEPYRRKALRALQQSGLRLDNIGGVRMWLFRDYVLEIGNSRGTASMKASEAALSRRCFPICSRSVLPSIFSRITVMRQP